MVELYPVGSHIGHGLGEGGGKVLLEATLRTLLLGIAFESNAQDPGRRPTLVCESDGGILVLDVVTCEARQAPMVRPSVEVGWSWQVGDVNWIARSGSIHAVRGWIVYEMFAANAPDKKRLLVGRSAPDFLSSAWFVDDGGSSSSLPLWSASGESFLYIRHGHKEGDGDDEVMECSFQERSSVPFRDQGLSLIPRPVVAEDGRICYERRHDRRTRSIVVDKWKGSDEPEVVWRASPIANCLAWSREANVIWLVSDTSAWAKNTVTGEVRSLLIGDIGGVDGTEFAGIALQESTGWVAIEVLGRPISVGKITSKPLLAITIVSNDAKIMNTCVGTIGGRRIRRVLGWMDE